MSQRLILLKFVIHLRLRCRPVRRLVRLAGIRFVALRILTDGTSVAELVETEFGILSSLIVIVVGDSLITLKGTILGPSAYCTTQSP